MAGAWHDEEGQFRLRLAGLDPAARYQDSTTGQDHTGVGLRHVGLDLPGGAAFGSTLIRLIRL